MRVAGVLALASLAGCAQLGHVEFPASPQPAPAPIVAVAPSTPTAGAIYDAGTYRPLFEDIRARRVGDVLTVQLVEKTSASRKASSSTDRNSTAKIDVGNVVHLPGKGLSGMAFDGKSGSQFEGKGETASDVLLSGVLTVTVVEVLPNGNLRVAGEKQVGVNTNVERLRLSGVVHPASIVAGNTVTSTQVADARIEVSGRGILDETQTMGWLQRFFQVAWPL